MIQDLFRCYVNGTETIMTRPEYEAQRALEARRGRPYAVKLGEKCGVRYDNEPEPAAPSSAPTEPMKPTPTVKPATISATGDAISQEPPAQAPAQKCQERPTAPVNAPTGGEQPARKRRPRPRRKPAEQAQNAPQNATGDTQKG